MFDTYLSNENHSPPLSKYKSLKVAWYCVFALFSVNRNNGNIKYAWLDSFKKPFVKIFQKMRLSIRKKDVYFVPIPKNRVSK